MRDIRARMVEKGRKRERENERDIGIERKGESGKYIMIQRERIIQIQ